MFKKKNHKNKPYVEMSTGQLIRHWLISKLPQQKEKIADQKIIEPVKFPNDDINYIAIVLDGVVEDVMRAQNRLAALLLSNPEFIEFDPKFDKPTPQQIKLQLQLLLQSNLYNQISVCD